VLHRQWCVLCRRKRLDFIINKRSGCLLLALRKFLEHDGRLSLVSSAPDKHDCTWRRPGMCSGASTASPPNYKRFVQFSLLVVSKANFLNFLTREDDTNHKPTLRRVADEQTPGFISLIIRAGGRRAVVSTVTNPMGVHVMRGTSTPAKKLEVSPRLYSVEWLQSGHVWCCAWRAVGGHWEGPTVVPGCSSIQPTGPTLLASMYHSRLLLRTQQKTQRYYEIYLALLSIQTVVWLLQRSGRWDASCQLVRKPVSGLWRLYESVSWRPSASVNPSNSVYLSHTITRTKRWNPRIYGVIRASRGFQTGVTIRPSDGS
jgi:hypothetical protein